MFFSVQMPSGGTANITVEAQDIAAAGSVQAAIKALSTFKNVNAANVVADVQASVEGSPTAIVDNGSVSVTPSST